MSYLSTDLSLCLLGGCPSLSPIVTSMSSDPEASILDGGETDLDLGDRLLFEPAAKSLMLDKWLCKDKFCGISYILCFVPWFFCLFRCVCHHMPNQRTKQKNPISLARLSIIGRNRLTTERASRYIMVHLIDLVSGWHHYHVRNHQFRQWCKIWTLEVSIPYYVVAP